MLTKAVKPGGGKIAPPPQLVHILDNLFKHANRAFNLPMPELPFQRLDLLVDDREDPAKDRSRADNMVGDLLHGPDLRRQMEPVNNRHRLRLPGPSIFLVIGVKVIATIAVVDDDRNILTSVAIALEGEGYRVQTYTDGSTALDDLKSNPPDLKDLIGSRSCLGRV